MPIWVVCVVVIVRHQSRRPELAQAPLEAVAPWRALKLDAEIERLQHEPVEQSLAKLSDVNMFHLVELQVFRPGLGHVLRGEYLPLGKEVGEEDLEAIMSDRRFLKVFDELGKMDKAAASAMLGRYLSSGLEVYLKLYDEKIRASAPQFKAKDLEGKRAYSGPAFEVGEVPEGTVVIAGARLNVLALVWISGMLDLSGSNSQVQRVAQLAVNQRKELYEDSTLDPFYRKEVLGAASLYNRQIICSSLLAGAPGDVQSSILKSIGASWQKRQLTSFRAAATQFDSRAVLGAAKPDYSSGSLNVKFISPLDDAGFDAVLEQLHLTQR